jgi:hypothetical protein
MADKTTLNAMRLQITTDRPQDGSSLVTFRFDFLLVEQTTDNDDDFCRHGTNGWNHAHHDKFDQLIAIRSANTGETAVSANLVYDSLYRINAYQIENKFRVIQGIERKMTKLQEKLGYPVDLADYASRLAQSLKIDLLLMLHDAQDRARTGYRWESIHMDGHAVNRLRSTIAKSLLPIESASEELATV